MVLLTVGTHRISDSDDDLLNLARELADQQSVALIVVRSSGVTTGL